MQTYPFEEFNKFWLASSVAPKPFDQPTLRIWEEFGRQQLEFINLCTEWGDREWQMLRSAKSPLEIFNVQSDITVEFSTRLAERSRDAITSMTAVAAREAMACSDWSKSYWTVMPSSEETTRHVRASKAAA